MTRVAIALALGLATGFAGCDKGKAEAVQTIPPHDGSSDPGEENVAAAVTIADAMTYIPDGANFVFGLDAARVGASKPMKDILDLPLYGHADELIAATQACKIATSTWNYAFVAGDMSDEGGLMVVVSAPSVVEQDSVAKVTTPPTTLAALLIGRLCPINSRFAPCQGAR